MTMTNRTNLVLLTTLALAAGACASEEANHTVEVQLVGTKGSETRQTFRMFDLDGAATDRALSAAVEMSRALAPLNDARANEGLSIRVRLDGDTVVEHHVARADVAKAEPGLGRFFETIETAAAVPGNAEVETRSSSLIVWGAAAQGVAAAVYLYRWLAPSDAGSEPDTGNGGGGVRS
jgi:hypothetical protein